MTYSYPKSAKDIMDAQKSRLRRQDGEIASLQLDVEDLERMVERIGRGLWDIVATTAMAADANPGEVTLASRLQAVLGMYELWAAVVDGDQP